MTESARFREASSTGDIDVVRGMLSDPKSEFDVNDRDPDQGAAALHLAVLSNHIDIVRILLKHPSCDINLSCTTEKGNTPLHLAISIGSVEIVRVILHHE
eukprot:317543_1